MVGAGETYTESPRQSLCLMTGPLAGLLRNQLKPESWTFQKMTAV